jgi:hypothetical protein
MGLGTVLILRWWDLKGSGGIERAVLRKIEDFPRKVVCWPKGCGSYIFEVCLWRSGSQWKRATLR